MDSSTPDTAITRATNDPNISLGRGWRELAKQIAFVGAAILFYFGVRGLTEGSAAVAIGHGRALYDLEQGLGIAFTPEAQEWFTQSPWLTRLANWIYIWGHWPVIIATLIWLHQRYRYHYLVLRNAMFVSGAIGLVIFSLYPVAPPRLSDIGFVDTVSTWSTSYRILQPPALVNKFAAVPSLHVGWNLLVGLELWRTALTWSGRVRSMILPVLMPVAVVVTANHFVLDAVAGVVVGLAGFVVARRLSLSLAGGELSDQ